MPKTKQVNWQPISQMPLISAMIDTSLNDTREHLDTLSKPSLEVATIGSDTET
jgi:hypothetical protein